MRAYFPVPVFNYTGEIDGGTGGLEAFSGERRRERSCEFGRRGVATPRLYFFGVFLFIQDSMSFTAC
jgi:hypothetical protein